MLEVSVISGRSDQKSCCLPSYINGACGAPLILIPGSDLTLPLASGPNSERSYCDQAGDRTGGDFDVKLQDKIVVRPMFTG